MKNPMIENNISAELFEAIDENNVNGGSIIHSIGGINACFRDTFGSHCMVIPVVSVVVAALCGATVTVTCKLTIKTK